MTEPDENARPHIPDFWSASQIRAARALLDWTQADLARATGLTSRNIGNLENGRGRELLEPKYIGRVIDALEGAGIMFVSDRKRKLTGVIFAGKQGQTH